MNPLIIEFKPGERRLFQLMGWQNPRVAIYARDEAGHPKVVELSTAYPFDPDTGLPFEFPIIVPDEIVPTVLVPPSCVASEQDIPHISRRLGKCFLYPQPKHEETLRCALTSFQTKAKKECAEEIAKLKNATPHDLFFYDALRAAVGSPDAPRSAEAVETERLRQIREIEDKYRQRLELTMEGLKRGETALTRRLRDEVLIAVWAKETGTDLEKMKQAAGEFESQWRDIWGPEPLLENIQDAQAAVKYGMRAAAGELFYLRSVSVRNPLTRDEAEDFASLESIQQLPRLAAGEHGIEVQAPGAANPRHSELLAEAQRLYSDGIMLNVGPLVDKMSTDEKLLFNLLVRQNPQHPGRPLSYRDIGKRLSVSHQEVKRRRKSLERKCGRDITRLIAEARAKNEKGMNPALCGRGKKTNTKNVSVESED